MKSFSQNHLLAEISLYFLFMSIYSNSIVCNSTIPFISFLLMQVNTIQFQIAPLNLLLEVLR